MIEPLEPRRLLTTIYVDGNPDISTHDGTSWNTAYGTLYLGLGNAKRGDVVLVADGVYRGSFTLVNGVSVYGGFAGFNAADPDARVPKATVLSGDVGIIGDSSDNAWRVVYASYLDASTIFDGFTVQDAKKDPYNPGGGLVSNASNSTFQNCSFVSNIGPGAEVYSRFPNFLNCDFAANQGEGMLLDDSGAMISNCTFQNNSDDGVRNSSSESSFTGCNFLENGGAGISMTLSSPQIRDCAFVGNQDGGLYCFKYAPMVSDCLFLKNVNSGSGGGIDSNESSPIITRCAFIANNAGGGGAIRGYKSFAKIIGSTFIGNSATYGGAVSALYGAPMLTNCVFSSSTALQGGAVYSYFSAVMFTNSVFWGNTATTGSLVYALGGAHGVSYSAVQGGYTGTGNINADPQFIRNPNPGSDGTWGTTDDDYGDLRLQATSPCIDAGSNAAVPVDVVTDPLGHPRIADVPGVRDPGAIVDMGAYEHVIPADASGDGKVNTLDFNILAGSFGQSGRTFAQGNFDYDPAGEVGSVDFGILAGQYGKTVAPLAGAIPGNPAPSLFAAQALASEIHTILT